MALVGDVIMSLRAAGPDPPSTLNPPILQAAASAQSGGTLTGSFFLIATATNPWGETLGSAEVSVTLGSNNAITGTVALPPGATGGRVYYTLSGGGMGTEAQYTPVGATGAFTILNTTRGSPGFVPAQSSAWNPDTDGDFVSTGLIYKWLNDGLTKLAGAAGGIEDSTGVATVAQQLYYQIPGRWIRFNTARYDQWPVVMGDRDYIQYRYNVSGVVSIIAGEAFSNFLGTVFSAFPEPGATSATTTLTAGMGVTDNSLTCVDASVFTPMGRIQIDNEIMAFSQVNGAGTPGSITGIIRGMAGTVPTTHAIGATVQELKFNFNGFRYAQLYQPGSALLNLDARYEWEVALNQYMLARYKEKEQSTDEALKLDQQFDQYCRHLRIDQANPITVSQIGGSLFQGRDAGRGRIIVN